MNKTIDKGERVKLATALVRDLPDDVIVGMMLEMLGIDPVVFGKFEEALAAGFSGFDAGNGSGNCGAGIVAGPAGFDEDGFISQEEEARIEALEHEILMPLKDMYTEMYTQLRQGPMARWQERRVDEAGRRAGRLELICEIRAFDGDAFTMRTAVKDADTLIAGMRIVTEKNVAAEAYGSAGLACGAELVELEPGYELVKEIPKGSPDLYSYYIEAMTAVNKLLM